MAQELQKAFIEEVPDFGELTLGIRTAAEDAAAEEGDEDA
jgi:hypothetical protein